MHFIPDYGDISKPDVRARYGYLEAGVSIFGNAAMFAVKLVLGIMINSISLIVDSFHTFSDTGTSVVVLLGFKTSKKAPDSEHPFGHGRAEFVATLIIAVLLVVVGLTFVLESGKRMIHVSPVEGRILVAVLMVVFAVVKELMARFSIILGKKIDSSTLIADAWHHRTDAVASVLVAVAVVGARYNYYMLDAIFGMAISALIIYTGVKLTKDASDILMGKTPDENVLKNVKSAAKSVGGVKDVHGIAVHDYGVSKVISMHVEVEKGISMEDAHNIATRVEDSVKTNVKAEVTVHIEPHGKESINRAEVEKNIRDIVMKCENVVSCHGVDIVFNGCSGVIEFHVVVDRHMSVDESHDMIHKLIYQVQKRYPRFKVHAHVEPVCG
ncbi:MAG: cation transporter [Euryarchaeota archaeon CG01_land_8_20_14_3_00_38_12]|nr:MAG: cation transporter [Euryarchaeota archaeon CG01_land_8_20_14_3_00_38_12]PJB22312.1 MAG: cation transporter [Euryarchaeota archaeon CG_4_9_14_3_um_filter_38_12]